MQRVRGDSSAPPTPWKPPATPVRETSGHAAVEPASTSSAVPLEEQAAGVEPGEYSPRRAAPEAGTNMSALRDLANSAARSAIDQHVRKRSGKQATGRLVGACLTVGISVVLAYWAWKTNSLQAAAGAIIGGCLGLHWTLAAIRRLLKLMQLNAPQTESSEIASTVEPIEIAIPDVEEISAEVPA